MLIPLMSRICKLWADVNREFSDLGENYLAGEGRYLDSRLRLCSGQAKEAYLKYHIS